MEVLLEDLLEEDPYEDDLLPPEYDDLLPPLLLPLASTNSVFMSTHANISKLTMFLIIFWIIIIIKVKKV